MSADFLMEFSGAPGQLAPSDASEVARAKNAVPFDSWNSTGAKLTAATGMAAGDRATVSAADTGTHTDPVVGGTVANAGRYTYSASPAGWQRVGNLDSQDAATQVTLVTAQASRAALQTYLASNPFADTTALNAYTNAALAIGDSTTIVNDGRYEVTSLTPKTWTRTGDSEAKKSTDAATSASGSAIAAAGVAVQKQDYHPPLQPTADQSTYVNAVRNRISGSVALPTNLFVSTSGIDVATIAHKSVYSDTAWDNRSEPAILEFAATATATGTRPSAYMYITPADLAKIGVVPDDTTPPKISIRGVIEHLNSINQTITNSTSTNGVMQIGLRYQGAGASLSGTISGSTDIIINSTTTTSAVGSSTGTVTLTASEKIFLRNGLPIPATQGGLALTGIIIGLYGNVTATGPFKLRLGSMALIAGNTILANQPYLNGLEDRPETAGTSSALIDTDRTIAATSGTSVLSSALVDGTGGTDYLLLATGESLAVGAVPAGTALSTVARHTGKHLMPGAGASPGAAAFSSYSDYITANDKEPFVGAAGNAVITKLNERFGYKPRVICAVSAVGGATINDIAVGTTYYRNLLTIVRNCVATSASQGRNLVVLPVLWSQGVNSPDLDLTSYVRGVGRFQQYVEQDIRAITKQTQTIPLIMLQTGEGLTVLTDDGPCSPLAQLEAFRLNPRIILAGPHYFIDPDPDAVLTKHTTAAGYHEMGSLAGCVAVEAFFAPMWSPIHVIDAWFNSAKTQVTLRFAVPHQVGTPNTNGTLALETDDTKVVISTLAAGKGIYMNDDAGDVPLSSPVVTGGNKVRLNVGRVPSGNVTVQIARVRTGAKNGRIEGARSGLRANTSYYTDPVTGKVLYHWACQQVVRMPS